MKIATGKVVTLSFDLCNEAGEIIESSEISGPVSFIHGKGSIIKGLDNRLNGMSEGDEATFEFPPEEAFGRPDDAPTKALSRAEFPAGAQLEVGSKFEAGLGGGGQTVVLQVVEATDEAVTVRMLHPLAGQKISMSVKIAGVRDPTAAEAESGQVMTKPPPPPPK